MRVKLFTFRYSATLGGFDETPLEEFARDKEVLAFREHFFTVNEVPHLLCVLTWQDALVSPEDLQAAREVPRRWIPPGRERGGNRPDPAEGLSEPERALFNTLRDWRSRKAHEEGVPPYLIFTNRELVSVVRRRPESPTALSNLAGIGAGKVNRYGGEVLAFLRGAPEPVLPDGKPSGAGEPAAAPAEVGR